MSAWQPIETAPKDTVAVDGHHRYGQRILAWPAVGGGVSRVRWWDANEPGETRWCNFLGDDGNAYRPTHWMPLPAPPSGEPT